MPTPPSPRAERAEPTGAVTVTADTSGPATEGRDGSLATMRDWLGSDAVAELPPRTGFGAAVAAALELAPAADWVWVLHDDCAPEPDARRRRL